MALFAQEMRLERRARAQQQALFTLESALEGVRARALSSGDYTEDVPPFVALPPGRGSSLHIDLTRDGTMPPNLWNVLATVRFAAQGVLVERSLGTRVWMPP